MNFFSRIHSRPRAALGLAIRGALLGLAVAGILSLQPQRAWAGDPDAGDGSGASDGSSDGTKPDDGSPGDGSVGDGSDDGTVATPVPPDGEGDGGIVYATGGASATPTPKPPKNHPPVALPSIFVARKGEALTGQFRASDRDKNDILTIQIMRQPTRGTVLIGTDGKFVYTPTTAYTGRDRFGFQVSDGKSHSQTRRIEIVYRVPKTPKPTQAKTVNPAPSAGSS